MKIKEMNLEDIQNRLKEIEEVEMNKEEANIKELTEEVRSLKERKEVIEEEVEERNKLTKEIAEGTAEARTVSKYEGDEMKNKKVEFNTKEEAIRSEAYESAFAKSYVVENPVFTEEEKRALDTTNGAVLIPHQWLNEIIDEIKESHAILQDLTWNQINAIVEIPRRLSIISGDAEIMEEGICHPGEENEFDSIQVDLVEVKKMLEITSKMGQLLPAAFKTWLISEVRDRIGAKLAEVAIDAIKTDILADNKITGEASLANILTVFGLADGAGVPKVYANRKTLYGSIYAIAGAQGQDAFVANPVDAMKGNLLGTELRVESALADNEVLVLFPQEVFFNVPGGIRVKSMEDDCFNIKITGVALAGTRLKYRKGAALLTLGE